MTRSDSPAPLKHLQVTCAVIEHEGRILAAQRGEGMTMALKWEFPGGKIMAGESPVECLRRELEEELGILVDVGLALPAVTHRYPECVVTLHPFICRLASREMILHEHRAVVWFSMDTLPDLDWAEADIPVLDLYRWRLTSIEQENESEAGRGGDG